MHDDHPHPLLSQVPLAVSPFISLPTAVPLPYSYKTLPSTLPPSILQPPQSQTQDQNQTPAYVVSSTGTTATPDQILHSCVALQKHLAEIRDGAARVWGEWVERRGREELVERRRVAPGWLDSGVHLIRPEAVGGREEEGEKMGGEEEGVAGSGTGSGNGRDTQEGEELDRVFGGLGVK
ncbi:hypothetical protein P153DRAFT_425839 [Dothidotthia symphoricarpi CBS 119687]|uniref:Uncharacterized protein n=1 Tax=Dothidotthia symphoricarpi CBS 119687 TaxID=1392245 RepID=A0A6A6A0U8_9PLEO|nr:uncharacterized protein P153DRAFT_425839 [Dothidotthia symphoricarpi CBS 119687]KAF2125440.1 hypothetical protein P153DRAFT_425839 [Dothidotthia symphoricarpi CBS 119687]